MASVLRCSHLNRALCEYVGFVNNKEIDNGKFYFWEVGF